MKTALFLAIAFGGAVWPAPAKAQYIEYDNALARQYKESLVSGSELTYPPEAARLTVTFVPHKKQ